MINEITDRRCFIFDTIYGFVWVSQSSPAIPALIFFQLSFFPALISDFCAGLPQQLMSVLPTRFVLSLPNAHGAGMVQTEGEKPSAVHMDLGSGRDMPTLNSQNTHHSV